ncbi:hypothetical protein SAMN05444156_2199 [Verrucomicrobium sp. GAS474]|nr:hypothetical protein SAMN05444156_2199 [Verrucomicrobium sp. GAS474]
MQTGSRTIVLEGYEVDRLRDIEVLGEVKLSRDRVATFYREQNLVTFLDRSQEPQVLLVRPTALTVALAGVA